MELPTVLGRTVLVDGCEAFPSIEALAALNPNSRQLHDELRQTLIRVRAYQDDLNKLQVITIKRLRTQGRALRWIAARFGFGSPAAVTQFVDRHHLGELRAAARSEAA